jgi:Transposase DDE domain
MGATQYYSGGAGCKSAFARFSASFNFRLLQHYPPESGHRQRGRPCRFWAEAVQQRLDANPEAMRLRRETVEHPFGTMKARMGATHFLTKTLPKVAAEMALSVLAYNLTRVMNIVGTEPLIAAITA